MPVRWREWALGVTPACDEDVMASGLATVWGHRPWGLRPAGADGHIHGAHLILPCPRMPSPAPRDTLCLGHRDLGLLVALKPYGCTLQGGPGLSRLLYWVLMTPLGASPWVGGRVWVGSQETPFPQAAPKASMASTAVRSATVPAGAAATASTGPASVTRGSTAASATWVSPTDPWALGSEVGRGHRVGWVLPAWVQLVFNHQSS